jgi:hypothetical protein
MYPAAAKSGWSPALPPVNYHMTRRSIMRHTSEMRFARLMAGELRRAGERSRIRFDSASFALRSDRGTLRLKNLYRQYHAVSRSQRREVLRRFVRVWFAGCKVEIPEQYEDVHPDLLPMVRGRAAWERFRSAQSPKLVAPTQPFAEHFVVGLAYDLPDCVRHVLAKHLAGWGVGFEQALGAACDNLCGISEQAFRRMGPGLWVSPWRDDHDAARLHLPDLLRRNEVKGDLIAMVPDVNTLLLTGTDDEDGLKAMASIAARPPGASRPLPTFAMRLKGESWAPYMPDLGHPAHAMFKRLSVQAIADAYGAQTATLYEWLHARGEDVFVANVFGLDGRGALRTNCVWADGVDTVLPRTDDIGFVGMHDGVPESLGGVDWQHAQQVMGDVMQPLGIYPERYRVKRFPTAAELARLITPGVGV